MRNTIYVPASSPYLILFMTNLLALYVFSSHTSYSQSNCPNPTTNQFNESYAQGTTVYYNLSNIGSPAIRQQIQNAINAWDTANQNNNSGVRFSSATPPSGAPTISFQLGSSDGSFAGHTDTTINASTGAIQSATVTFYVDGQTPNGNFIYEPEEPGYDEIFLKIALHEIGHTLGLDDASVPAAGYCAQPNGATVMNGYCGTNDQGGNYATTVTTCDNDAINSSNSPYPPPYPTPTPCDQLETSWTCTDSIDNDCDGYADNDDNDCLCRDGGNNGIDIDSDGICGDLDCDDYDPSYPVPNVCPYSPIVIDVQGDGFNMTSAANGVNFNLDSIGTIERISWTAENVDDAWLILDRNGNGTVDNGRELFGNYTPQPMPPQGQSKNGFLALAEYDKPANGGNSDGMITKQDAIFNDLRLWHDVNHNGISEASELRRLRAFGLKSIDLDYKESKRTDQYGNRFRYRSKVKDTRDAQLGRWAWDVFLIRQ